MESNVQKMRKAARHLLCVIEEMGFKPWCADDPLAIACDKLDAALSLPLRNCDVGTAEKQGRRCRETFSAWRNKFPNDMLIDAVLKWAQMPYEADAKKEECNDAE